MRRPATGAPTFSCMSQSPLSTAAESNPTSALTSLATSRSARPSSVSGYVAAGV